MHTEDLSQNDISINCENENETMFIHPYRLLQKKVENEIDLLGRCEKFPQVAKK